MRNRENEEPSYSFDPYLADATSVRDAIIVRQIQHKLAEYRVLAKYHAKQMVYIDGKLAVPFTIRQVERLNPYWSRSSIIRSLNQLKQCGILYSVDYYSTNHINYYIVYNYILNRISNYGKRAFD